MLGLLEICLIIDFLAEVPSSEVFLIHRHHPVHNDLSALRCGNDLSLKQLSIFLLPDEEGSADVVVSGDKHLEKLASTCFLLHMDTCSLTQGQNGLKLPDLGLQVWQLVVFSVWD